MFCGVEHPVVFSARMEDRNLEQRGIISPANVQTVVVVGFVIALLALVLAIFNSYKMSSAAHVATDWLEHYSTTAAETQAELASLRAKVASLESELEDAKKMMSQPVVVGQPTEPSTQDAANNP